MIMILPSSTLKILFFSFSFITKWTELFALLPLLKFIAATAQMYHCPCPPTRDLGSSFGLVLRWGWSKITFDSCFLRWSLVCLIVCVLLFCFFSCFFYVFVWHCHHLPSIRPWAKDDRNKQVASLLVFCLSYWYRFFFFFLVVGLFLFLISKRKIPSWP